MLSVSLQLSIHYQNHRELRADAVCPTAVPHSIVCFTSPSPRFPSFLLFTSPLGAPFVLHPERLMSVFFFSSSSSSCCCFCRFSPPSFLVFFWSSHHIGAWCLHVCVREVCLWPGFDLREFGVKRSEASQWMHEQRHRYIYVEIHRMMKTHARAQVWCCYWTALGFSLKNDWRQKEEKDRGERRKKAAGIDLGSDLPKIQPIRFASGLILTAHIRRHTVSPLTLFFTSYQDCLLLIFPSH